ncbi:restriction endonuclease subunit S [Echinicola marina]|uniref:restriction endonuclease subunit S n=1 Tax=Echinicola marina TaxID=2859768 RepID=UPI001CF6B52B|nr:restriction endonuclease subunit S [Echinicola marina]UCS95293.1 restriction endonuclease subunit S [Echinicola marina]
MSVNSYDRPAGENQFGILKTSSVYGGIFKPSENKEVIESEISRAKLNPKKNSIIISRMNTPDLVGEIAYVNRDYPYLFIPDRLWLTKTNSDINVKWLSYLLITPKQRSIISSIGSGTSGSMKNISKPNFLGLKVICPFLDEQQKIADFITSLDQRIETQIKIIEQLETLMSGLRQKIFSQQLRFKDDEENDFPEWEEKKLGEIGETYNGLTGKTKKNFGRGENFIQYKQIFDSSMINIIKCGLVDVSESENQNKVKFGDVFFTVSSETPNEIGMSSVLLNDVQNVYLNSFCFGYRPFSLEMLNPYFARYLFRSNTFRDKIIKLAQGSTRFNLSKVELMKLKILLPTHSEQIKIANFLSAIGKKIEAENEILTQYQSQKKYFLQNLFI